uniref:Uncharacterized protein n=1 Tax=Setaria italica TaxID=4555 RepID=K4AHW2_SETIT
MHSIELEMHQLQASTEGRLHSLVPSTRALLAELFFWRPQFFFLSVSNTIYLKLPSW